MYVSVAVEYESKVEQIDLMVINACDSVCKVNVIDVNIKNSFYAFNSQL